MYQLRNGIQESPDLNKMKSYRQNIDLLTFNLHQAAKDRDGKKF